MKRFSILILALFLCTATSASAYTALSGTDISLKNPVSDDVYVAGSEVNIDQPVSGDLTVFGGTVHVYEDVSGDVLVAGGRVVIHSNVGGDVRVAAGMVTISGNVKGDLIMAGSILDLSRTATVGGSVMVHGGMVTLEGNVSEHIDGTASIMKIKGWVTGNVHVSAHNYLSVGQGAKIRGNLSYFSKNPIVLPEGVVTGKVERVAPYFATQQTLIYGFLNTGMLLGMLWNLLSLLLLGAIVLLFAPHEFMKLPDVMRKSFWRSLGVGFLGVTAGTAFVLMCAVTIIGMPLALILGFGFFTLWYLSQLVVGLFLGSLMLRSKQRSVRRTYGVLALGLLVASVIALIPLIGGVVIFILMLAAFGVMLRRKYEWAMVVRGRR